MPELPKVLIVDDEQDLGDILADYLEDEFTCSVCSNPEKALHLIKDTTFDIVISDMHMPKVDGFQIIEVVSKQQPDTPVILLTGNSRNDPIVIEALEKGAKGIITKPFNSPQEVLDYLKKFIET